MSVEVRVNPGDDERVLLLHAVRAVLSIRKGGPVGKGGQNSDEALVASRFLSGHAPPDPTAPNERSAAASPEPTGPHERHPKGQFVRRSDSKPAACPHLHCLCNNHDGYPQRRERRD
jgi:hypothetical protein